MTHYERLTKLPNFPGDWKERHMQAVHNPLRGESGIVRLLEGWLKYADNHRCRFESGIGDDGVLGPEWAQIGAGIRGLLNGDCGRLDCGTLDSVICGALTTEGFDPDDL